MAYSYPDQKFLSYKYFPVPFFDKEEVNTTVFIISNKEVPTSTVRCRYQLSLLVLKVQLRN